MLANVDIPVLREVPDFTRTTYGNEEQSFSRIFPVITLVPDQNFFCYLANVGYVSASDQTLDNAK